MVLLLLYRCRFQNFLNNLVFVYLDDIVVYAESLEKHDKKARRLFDRLRDGNLKLQPDKCDFLRTEVAYLGHIIGRDGVKPNPAKINAIRKSPRPTTVRAIRQFLGLSGYYRRFIKDYAKIAKPLSDLLKKDVKWEGGCSRRRSFRKLRRYLCKTPILLYPNFQKTFKLTTDASDHTVGAILTQEKDGVDMPVAYFSKTMNACKQKYAKAEKVPCRVICCDELPNVSVRPRIHISLRLRANTLDNIR